MPSSSDMHHDKNRGRHTGGRGSAAEEDGAADSAPGAAGNRRRSRPPWKTPPGLTLFLLAVLALLILSVIYLRDEPEPWDDDLRRPVFVQPQPDMSAPGRMKAMLTGAAKLPKNDPAALSPWTEPLEKVAGLLDRHAPALDNLRDLLEEKPEEWEPRSPLWKFENFAADAAWRNVILLKEAESAHLARRGQEEPAFLAACDLLVLGCLLERLDAWPEFMNRAMELHEHGTRTLARLLAMTRLPDDRLRRLQEEEFGQWAPSVEKLSAAMDGFYCFERKLLLGPDGDDPPVPLWYLPARSGSRIFFKPRATLRLFAESFRELKSETGRTAFSRTNRIDSRVLAGSLTGGANRSGEDYFGVRIRAYTAMLDRNALERARHAIVQTLFAARRFVLRESRLPAKLEELVPRYLAALPLDPFSGEPLRYKAAGGLIYSVGLNFKDEGGRVSAVPLADEDEPTAGLGVGVAKLNP